MDAYEGWASDPFAAHEARYFVDGRPTRLVRDGTVESFDEPPVETTQPPAPSADLTEAASADVTPALPVDVTPALPVDVTPALPVDESAGQPADERPDPPPVDAPPPPPGTSYWSPPPPPAHLDVEPAGSSPGAARPGLGIGLTDTFVVGSDPVPTRRRRKALVACLVALVVAVSTVVVIVGGGKSAEAAVIDSVNTTLADSTAHVSLDMTVQGPSASVSGTGSGGIDFSQNALQLQLNVSAAGQSVPVQLLYIAGSVYEAVPGIDQLVPGKSWISLDVSSLQGPTAAQDPGALSTGDNPAATLRLLTQQGNTVVGLGPSTVDGAAVQGYSVVISAATVKAQLASANLPSWLKAALSGVVIQGITDKVYIDGSGLLRRYSMDLSETVPSRGTVTVEESLDFSDYGTPVVVNAPPADQTMSFTQFIDALHAAAS